MGTRGQEDATPHQKNKERKARRSTAGQTNRRARQRHPQAEKRKQAPRTPPWPPVRFKGSSESEQNKRLPNGLGEGAPEERRGCGEFLEKNMGVINKGAREQDLGGLKRMIWLLF